MCKKKNILSNFAKKYRFFNAIVFIFCKTQGYEHISKSSFEYMAEGKVETKKIEIQNPYVIDP